MFQEEITMPNWKRQKRNGDENKSCNEENMNILLHEKEFSDVVNDNINSDLIICQANQSLLQENRDIRRNIIYADPPWKYTIERSDNCQQSPIKGTANSHYPTLSLHQLKQLKIQEITADDCILLMWTTGPQLENALELMQSWGFHYNTLFMTWVKTSNGGQIGRGARLGFYTRQTVEMVLMGTRGHVHKYKKPREEMLYNILLEDPEEHSRKPSRVKKVIDRMFLDVPRIELFARIVNKNDRN